MESKPYTHLHPTNNNFETNCLQTGVFYDNLPGEDSLCEWPSMNQELHHQDCGQAMRPTVPTNFQRTNCVQQPKPLSRSQLSASTVTHTKYQQQQPLWKKRLLGKKKLCVCVSLWKNNVAEEEQEKTEPMQFIFLKCFPN